MSKIQLASLVEKQTQILDEIEGGGPANLPVLPASLVLKALVNRDAIQDALVAKHQVDEIELARLVALDARLRQQSRQLVGAIDMQAVRRTVSPRSEAWWWFLDQSEPYFDRLDWLWGGLVLALLTISLSLIVDISTRFMTGGPDGWATFAVVAQSVLAMLAVGGTLTKTGRQFVEFLLKSARIPAYSWNKIRLAGAASLLMVTLLLRLSLPRISITYNNRGLDRYLAGQYTSAQYDYERAIRLNPDYPEAHYNLGLVYDELQRYEDARSEYRLAAASGLDAAYNNLAHLYILDENYAAAVPLLLTGLTLSPDEAVRYDLLKNLGWARLRQTRYAEARSHLQDAIALSDEQAAAHCLLAQVLDGQGETKQAALEWEKCLKYADSRRGEEDLWIHMARQHMKGTP